MDSLTGIIDPAASLSGTYQISYTIPATSLCSSVSVTAQVTISSATIVVSNPKDQTILYPADALFGVIAGGNNLVYQWQVDKGSGFEDLSNTGVYSGVFTDTLRLKSPYVYMSGYLYRVIVSGVCAPAAVSGQALLTVKLTEHVLTVTAKADDKMYDGNTLASIYLSDDRQPGDSLIVTYTGANFDNQHVGIDKPVFVTGILVSGPDAYKYSYNIITTTIADITPKPITVIATSGLTKVYNAPDPKFTYSYSPQLITGDTFTGSLTRVPGENPDTYPILLGSLSLSSDYSLLYIPADFTITVVRNITIYVKANQSKVYGDPDPVIEYWYEPELDEGDFFTGQLSRDPGENVSTYAINKGTLKTSPKYGVFLNPSYFAITPKPITVTSVADYKEYDGTVASDERPTIVPGLAFFDRAEFIQTYDHKNVGEGKTMIPSGQVKDGNNGMNYMVDFDTVYLGIITPKPITGHITVPNKTYDATVAATIISRTLTGVIPGDIVNYVGGSATFDTPTVGKDKLVSGIGFSLSGLDAPNYTVNPTADTKADILVLVVGTSLSVNASTFTHYSDQITLTATVYGGAPKANGAVAAGTVTFAIEGRVIRDNANNADIPVVISGEDLVATITVSVLETTVTGSMVPGTKEASATFSDENINYQLVPNPAKASFDFIPGFNILVYPNPSPGPVSFKISVDVGAMVTLELYASNGQLVARIFEGFIPTGESKTIPFTGHIAQGIYRYRVMIGSEVKVGNVIIIGVY